MNASLLRLPFFACATLLLAIAPQARARPSTFVDADGVLRWTQSNAEIALFGANYTTPFAHAFRAHKRLGVDWRVAIDADVYHMARLGFDAYRIHVWDREISDLEGNLLVNEHVAAFDYLFQRLKERGIKTILTPLQFGNAGHPEPGVPLPGFSTNYGKRGSLEDRASWPLQERYLAQFMSHVNPHTGLAYKDDPDVVAVEICNEPGHFDYDLAVAYINTMARAIRATGCEKPILYNMSHGLGVFEAYLDAEVQGGTFQWYPSNLVAGHEQRGNFLPYVDTYPIPFADHPKFKNKAKIVYEFDAADIGRSYIYPAMARTYRTAGFQFATQFAYDPLYLAPFNTEYQTHYLNLAYSPQKAIALKITAEAFRRVPLGKSYGAYPQNTTFEGVRVSYPDDLAELVTDDTYFHSNTTTSAPPAPDRLTRIAGCGSSPLVGYAGSGAYFIDRLEPGVWRLEVMPDAIAIRDPFEKASPLKQVTRIAWNAWPMRLELPDLGRDFHLAGLNSGNTTTARADGTTVAVRPGTYLLTRDGVNSTAWNGERPWQNFRLNEFVAPAPSLDRVCVLHTPGGEASVGETLHLTATVAAPLPPDAVELIAYFPADPIEVARAARPVARAQPGGGNVPGPGIVNTGGGRVFPMRHIAGLRYAVDLPAADLRDGTLRYHISVRTAEQVTTFPAGLAAHPFDWQFFGEPWQLTLVPAEAPLLLFDAATDSTLVTANARDVAYDLLPSDRPGVVAMRVLAHDLDRAGHDHSFRSFFKERIAHRTPRLATAKQLVIHARSATDRPCLVQLALITSDGIAYGAPLTIGPEFATHTVELAELKQIRSPNIPHGYPSFIAFWSEVETALPLDIRKAESVLLSIGPGIAPADHAQPHGIDLERVWLE